MVDLHTHILPEMDDGAADVAVSLAMLRREYEQGVHTVVLSPHFYREQERPHHFLQRRNASYFRLMDGISALSQEEQRMLPAVKLAAEVAWVPNLYETDSLDAFCIEGTRNLLLELPFHPWGGALFDQIYNLMGHTGITPVLVHVERYFGIQKAPLLESLWSLDVPIQVNAESFLFRGTRRRMLKLVKDGQVHVMASDCHNLTRRVPNLKDGYSVIEKKCGREVVDTFLENAEMIAGMH